MKALIAMVAFLAIIGIAGAWEETNYLNYQFKSVQQGNRHSGRRASGLV